MTLFRAHSTSSATGSNSGRRSEHRATGDNWGSTHSRSFKHNNLAVSAHQKNIARGFVWYSARGRKKALQQHTIKKETKEKGGKEQQLPTVVAEHCRTLLGNLPINIEEGSLLV
uniref:Uncharacterized protein n=1 Tax=Trypanosoma vivax (strain Y486) TaxID=1055687 RepID=G0U8B3_TRYVY|nr:hypothetical protein TVY486_1011670 [Trypanosoma vivax Y486]